MNIPCLMICHNRLEYTKKALLTLMNSDCGTIYIIDNASTDGTQDWLTDNVPNNYAFKMKVTIFNKENYGIAYAMNQFLILTKDYEFVCKCDNDTLVEPLWCNRLLNVLYKYNLDIVQAKHPIIKATHPGGWEGYTKNMKRIARGILENHYVGGSGIVFRRSIVDKIPETEWKLGGWREWQRQHPEIRKAFCENVSIELLDEGGYNDYPEYYKSTGRLK